MKNAVVLPKRCAVYARVSSDERLDQSFNSIDAQKEAGHAFIASQREGLEVFRHLDPKAPLIVAEAVWQYSHHVLAGLLAHQGPLLTVANWSGTWPGLLSPGAGACF